MRDCVHESIGSVPRHGSADSSTDLFPSLHVSLEGYYFHLQVLMQHESDSFRKMSDANALIDRLCTMSVSNLDELEVVLVSIKSMLGCEQNRKSG